MEFMRALQLQLEETYGAPTGLDVRDFLHVAPDVPGHGRLLVEHEKSGDLNIAILLDKDIFSAWRKADGAAPKNAQAVSVLTEELSHFVYLAFNHRRGRNVTSMEMELQSEVDRVLMAFHGPFPATARVAGRLLAAVFDEEYTEDRYERSRRAAAAWLRQLCDGDPRAWGPREFEQLRRFFHSDLSEKFALSRNFERRRFS